MVYFRLFLLVSFFSFASAAKASDTFFRYFQIEASLSSSGYGTHCKVSVSEQSTICQIKSEIQKYCHVPVDQQKMVYTYKLPSTDYSSEKSTEFKNGKTLGEYAAIFQDKGFAIKTMSIDIVPQETSQEISCK